MNESDIERTSRDGAVLVEPVRANVRGRHPSPAGMRMRGLRHWRWHLDKVFVKINGERNYLWRAVDHEGEVLESYKARRSVAGPSGNRSPSKVDVFGPRAPIGDELRLD